MAKGKPGSVSEKLKAKLGRAPVPDLGLVAAEFIDRAGGPRNFGGLLWGEFIKASEGSLARQRIIELVGRFIKGAEAKLSADDLDLLDDVELEQLLIDAAHRAGVTTDAGASPGPAPAGAEAQGPAERPDPGEAAGEGRGPAAPGEDAGQAAG